MRTWAKLLLGASAALAVVACAGFVLDIRAPRSDLAAENAIAALILISNGNEKLAGMYGVFAVTSNGATEGIFPFSYAPDVPGHVAASEPSIKNLQDRFGSSFPAKFLAFKDTDWTQDSCASSPSQELGFGPRAALLRLGSQASCVVHWKGAHPSSMLISVTLADGDPWMRPFARWMCRTMTQAALEKLGSHNRERPAYAACVLVDRPDRRKPGDAQDTFKSIVYELRDGTPARMN